MNGRAFTGRHFAAVMLGGFGVVIAVNLAMAVLAARSHPGMVVESSHVAGQKFNGWLEAGRAQRARGWDVAVTMDGRILQVDASNALKAPLLDAAVEARVRHPLGQEEAAVLMLADAGAGRYRGTVPVPPGQWDVELRVRRGGEQHWMKTRIQVAG